MPHVMKFRAWYLSTSLLLAAVAAMTQALSIFQSIYKINSLILHLMHHHEARTSCCLASRARTCSRSLNVNGDLKRKKLFYNYNYTHQAPFRSSLEIALLAKLMTSWRASINLAIHRESAIASLTSILQLIKQACQTHLAYCTNISPAL